MRLFLLCAFLVIANQVLSQDQTLRFEFRFTYNDAPIELASKLLIQNTTDSIQFDVLKMYIGNLSLESKGGISQQNDVHLLDLSIPESLTFEIQNQPIPYTFGFDIGIDSLTNVSGAMGGDLDPLKGMYWTWQSGYINIKIEGIATSSSARNNEFQYHLGGYQFSKKAIQRRSFNASNQSHFIFELPLDKLIPALDLAQTPAIMSPSTKAVELSEHIASELKLVR